MSKMEKTLWGLMKLVGIIVFPIFTVAYCECLKIWEKAGGTVVLYLVCGVVAIIVMTKSMDFKKIIEGTRRSY